MPKRNNAITVVFIVFIYLGYLMGFGSKEGIAEEMRKQEKPLFLLRFSDSQLGALSISRFDSDSNGYDNLIYLSALSYSDN
jgi:hypothetical protein